MRRTLLVAVVFLGCGLLFSTERANAQIPDQFIKALYRYAPVMRFDNGFIPFIDDTEHFFPVRVSAITNNPDNRLERGIFPNVGIATRHDDGTGLSLSYLRAEGAKYPRADELGDDIIKPTDRINEHNLPGVPNEININIYRADAARFQNDPHYRDRIYGHIVLHYDGTTLKGAWLQYWFFYYYNDFPLVDLGDHEGDWEMIQLFVGNDVQPKVAVYSQHGGHTYCPWAKVPKERARPVVFVARGSHASYFHTGHHGQDFFIDGDNERSMRLIRIGTKWPRWVTWPGYYGGSEGIAGEFHSPRGPIGHDQFIHPQSYLESASLDGDCN